MIFTDKGFSFLGLLVLVLMLSLFTGSLFMVVGPSQQVGQADSTFKKADEIVEALKKYKTEHAGAAPATLDGLVTPTGPACAMDTVVTSPTYRRFQGWCGPYLDRPISQNPNSFKTDGWGTVFQYDTVTLRSCGSDRTCGNGDDLTFTSF